MVKPCGATKNVVENSYFCEVRWRKHILKGNILSKPGPRAGRAYYNAVSY